MVEKPLFLTADCWYDINLLYKIICTKSIVYIIYNDFLENEVAE